MSDKADHNMCKKGGTDLEPHSISSRGRFCRNSERTFWVPVVLDTLLMNLVKNYKQPAHHTIFF